MENRSNRQRKPRPAAAQGFVLAAPPLPAALQRSNSAPLGPGQEGRAPSSWKRGCWGKPGPGGRWLRWGGVQHAAGNAGSCLRKTGHKAEKRRKDGKATLPAKNIMFCTEGRVGSAVQEVNRLTRAPAILGEAPGNRFQGRVLSHTSLWPSPRSTVPICERGITLGPCSPPDC